MLTAGTAKHLYFYAGSKTRFRFGQGHEKLDLQVPTSARPAFRSTSWDPSSRPFAGRYSNTDSLKSIDHSLKVPNSDAAPWRIRKRHHSTEIREIDLETCTETHVITPPESIVFIGRLNFNRTDPFLSFWCGLRFARNKTNTRKIKCLRSRRARNMQKLFVRFPK